MSVVEKRRSAQYVHVTLMEVGGKIIYVIFYGFFLGRISLLAIDMYERTSVTCILHIVDIYKI